MNIAFESVIFSPSPALYLLIAALCLVVALRLARGLLAPIQVLVRSAAAVVVALFLIVAALALVGLALLAGLGL